MTALTASHAPARVRAHRRARASASQRMMALLLVALAASLVVWNDAARQAEALTTAAAIQSILGLNVDLAPGDTLLTIGAGSTAMFSLRLDIACSFALLVIPVLLVTAAMLTTGRTTVPRAVPLVATGSFLLVLVNALRLVVVAALTHADGVEGFNWSHTVYGSLIALTGLAAVLVGMVWVTGRTSRGARTRRRGVGS